MRSFVLPGLSLLATLIIVPGGSFEPHGQSSLKSGQVEVSFNPSAETFALHEPIVVLFSVHNGLASPIIITLGAQKRQFFQFYLTPPKGEVLQSSFPPPGQVDVVTFGPGTQEIAPGADYKQRLVINQWFSFPIKGVYSLKGQLTSEIAANGAGSLFTPAQTIPIRIGDKNSVILEKTCSELTKRVENGLSVEEWEEPALELSYIDDPIAVKYMAQVLSTHKGAENLIVPGLERIGDDSAIEVLLSSLNDASGDMSMLSRRALTRLQPRISDSYLKETVQRALATSSND